MTGIRVGQNTYNVSEQFATQFKTAVDSGNEVNRGEARTLEGYVQPSSEANPNQDAAALASINTNLGQNSSVMVDTNTADGIAPVMVKFKKPTTISAATLVTGSNTSVTSPSGGPSTPGSTSETGYTSVSGRVSVTTGSGINITAQGQNISGQNDRGSVNSTNYSLQVNNNSDTQTQLNTSSADALRRAGFQP